MQRTKRAQQILDLYNQGKSKQEIMQIMNYKSDSFIRKTILHLYNITKNENQKTIYRLDTSIKENMQILKNSIYKDNIGLRRKYMILHEKV